MNQGSPLLNKLAEVSLCHFQLRESYSKFQIQT